MTQVKDRSVQNEVYTYEAVLCILIALQESGYLINFDPDKHLEGLILHLDNLALEFEQANDDSSNQTEV